MQRQSQDLCVKGEEKQIEMILTAIVTIIIVRDKIRHGLNEESSLLDMSTRLVELIIISCYYQYSRTEVMN